MSPAQASPEETAERAPAPRQALSLRALGLGLLMLIIIVGMTQTLSIQYHAAEVAGDAPPPAPTYFLFAYVLLLLPLLQRLGRRLALTRGELLFLYTVMLIVGPITHLFGIGFLVPHTVAPSYFNAQEPGWQLFRATLPTWLGPNSPDAVSGFFHGTHGVVPWQAWLTPILAWSSLLIALFFVMLCINVMIRRQWVENERLVFPLAAIPIVLAEEGSASARNQPSRFIREPVFWLGLLAVLALQAPAMLNRYIPSIPALPLRDIVLVDASTNLPAPWNGLGQIEFHILFWLIGVAYLLPKEVALSAWVFYFIGLLENVVAVHYGTTGESPSVYSNDFPALYAQGAGAAFALTGITLYTARRHLRLVWRKALHNDPSVDDSTEFLSYRTALVGLVLGSAFILGWCGLAGMRLWVAALLFGLVLAYFFIFTRIRAEAGLGMGIILWPKMLDEVMLTLVGAKYLTLPDMTMLSSLRWLYFGPAIGSVMACQLEGFKLTDAGGVPRRGVGRWLAGVATLTVPLAFVWTLQTYYNSGFETMAVGRRATSMVGTQIHWSYQSLIEAVNSPTGPQWNGILAMTVGVLITVALSALRTRFLWFSLHPIGFLAANSWGMHINWFSFFFGWLVKSLVMRYGGMNLYQRLLPLFLGLILGDLVHQGIWGFVAWATGGPR